MSLDYDKLNGYAVKDPIGRLCLHEMWLERFKLLFNPYVGLSNIMEFLTRSMQYEKIKHYVIKTLEQNDISCKIIIEVIDFDDCKSYVPLIVSKTDYDNSPLREIETFRNELNEYLPLTHEVKEKLRDNLNI